MLTPERMQQIEAILHDAGKLPSVERTAFIAQACAGDEALRCEVELRLTSGEEAPTIPLAAPLLEAGQPSSLAGQSISHYQIVSLLGKGGMGEVYQARDTQLDRTVALKILPARVAADKERMQRFVREAKAASALNHPHVATIYEIGEAAGVSFIAMEYVAGQSLAAKINGHPLTVKEIVELGSQIADALDEAHSKGITHRDIKPANVMLTLRGQVKVLDFGLARIARPQSIDSRVSTLAQTTPGVMMGTVPYMSPEQALGRDVDQRSDLFSLGAVLYEMATGRLPFAGTSTSETLDRILHAQPEAMARFNYDVPAELERIVRKCLEKERERRYQAARELLVDLKNLQRDSDSKAVSAEPLTLAPKRSLTLLRLASILLVSLVLTGVIAYWLSPRNPAIKSVAVLPFINVGASPDTEYLSDGIAESLIRSLSQLPLLTVMSRDSAFRYKNRDVAAQIAGQELKVQAVLTGRVTQRGDDLSISVELVDVNNNRHLWGEQYQQKLANLMQVQETIAREISNKLRLKLTSDEQHRLTKSYPENVEASKFYMKGRNFAERRTGEAWQKAIESYQKALALDPNYTLAYIGLADAYFQDQREPRSVMVPRSKALTIRALALDESLGEAHASLARVLWQYEWKWSEAEREFKRALELDPGNAFVHRIYGYYLSSMGQHDESVAQMKQAQQLDPLSPIINLDIGQMLYFAGQIVPALEQFQKTQLLEPNFFPAYERIGMAYTELGRYEEAIAALGKARALEGNSPDAIALLGHAYARWGKRDEALKRLDELKELSTRRYVSSYWHALIYTNLGEKDQAFQALQRACQERVPYLVYLKVDIKFESLRTDPRFADLLRCVGLPQ